ncbi:MAG: hypothetical protein EXS46_01055 [Candidatus Taylorbacteria bacterium]|nr:hypothetical protein [Candidatus Taylorbacteria bacterium]
MKIFLMKKNLTRGLPLMIFFVGLLFVSSNNSLSAEVVTKNSCPYVWSRNLKVGMVGEDVFKLQQFLNLDSETAVALSGAGSVGNEVKSYGSRTVLAVKKFQEKYKNDVLIPAGITTASGFVGSLTRAKLNSLCGISTVGLSLPVNIKQPSSVENFQNVSILNTLTVTVPDQPAKTLAPQNAGWVPFTSVTLTAGDVDVVVKSVAIERTGFGADGAFYSIVLADQDENQLGLSRSLRSDHKVELGDSFVIPAKTSKTITVMANMNSDLSNFNGQMPTFQINSINTDAKILGTFPIRGTYQTVNSSLVIGTAYATLSQYDPGISTNKYINDKGVRFSGVRFSADSKEDLEFSAIVWNQVGSASNNDFTNISTVVNGVSYPVTVEGKKFTSVFDPPIFILKGNSIDVYVQGDFTATGSNRTVEFDIQKSEGISLLGKTFGYYVLVLPNSSTATSGHSVFITSDGSTSGSEGTPFFSGSIVTVNSGTFSTIEKR